MRIIIGLWLSIAAVAEFIPANTTNFYYEGRWAETPDYKFADWPCSGFHFDVSATGVTQLKMKWHGLRTRIKISILDH
jgi:hypothetical protein